MKKSAASLAASIALLLTTTLVNDVAASCGKVANEEMVEYSCEGGQPGDLATVPETTEKLRINGMPLGRITADTFSRFGGNLWVLSCSHCEITDIDADAFRRLVNLQQLNLNSNRLTTVKASWLRGLDYLTYLDLNYNDIRDIEDDVFRNLPNLVDFRISGNRLRCLNLGEMSHLKELKRIFLNENSDFACPHAVSKYLENRGVAFEPDPEWRKITSDTIVPPSYAEEEEEEDPRILRPDKRPQEPEVPPYVPPSRDRTFHPDRHAETYRSRHRRPTTTLRPTTIYRQPNEIPRVEPISPTRPSPSDSSGNHLQRVITYPRITYSPETLPEPPMEDIRGPSEDIRMIGTTSNVPSQTEHVASAYPQRVSTSRETTPYSTLERLRVSAVGSETSSEDDDRETTVESDRWSQRNDDTVTYPLYSATFDESSPPHGSIQVTHHGTDSDMVTLESWSVPSNKHNTGPYWTHQHGHITERNDDRTSPSWSSTNAPDLRETPYYVRHDPRKMIVDESSNPGNVIATDPVDQSSQSEAATTTTTTMSVHYVRPVLPTSPELMYSPSSSPGEFYRAPYYETSVTVHPPLQDYREAATEKNDDSSTETDEPLPNCPDNSANSMRSYIAVLAMSLVTAVFGRVVADGF